MDRLEQSTVPCNLVQILNLEQPLIDDVRSKLVGLMCIYIYIKTASGYPLNIKTQASSKKKLDLQGLDSLWVFRLKKTIFSRRSRKSPNTRPIHTQGAKLRERIVS
jgi:hypothetical protein